MNSPPTSSSSPDPLLDRLCAPDAGGAGAPRALLVVAHPDDETLGAGARLHRFADLHILHLTDGAPRDPRFARRAGLEGAAEYAAVRRRELGAAMAIAGVPEDRLHALGAVDQDAAYELVRLTRAIADFVDMLRPEVVLTHPYEGGHPDHDAAAFVVAAAVALVKRDIAAPEVVEMAYYHEGAGKVYGDFLDVPGASPRAAVLTGDERARKRRMLACHATQREVLARFPVEVERFRRAPRYDFGAPPHAGTLHYEAWKWEMDGPRWRSLATAAMTALGYASLQDDG